LEATATPNPIRAAREKAGMSREELAFKSGLSFKTLERLEAGAHAPRRATLFVIADALGCGVDDLNGGDGPDREAA
jgi:transcriptional regulator with XRE-family HTH domain